MRSGPSLSRGLQPQSPRGEPLSSPGRPLGSLHPDVGSCTLPGLGESPGSAGRFAVLAAAARPSQPLLCGLHTRPPRRARTAHLRGRGRPAPRRLARLPAWAPGTRSGLAMAVATRGGARILPAPSHLGRPGEAGRQVSAARGGAAPVPAWGRRLGPAPSGTKPSERE